MGLGAGGEVEVAPWNWGSVNVPVLEVPTAEAPGVLTALELPDLDPGDLVARCPSLCMAACICDGVDGGLPLMVCRLEASGMFLPNLASKELRLRYVRSADMRAAPRPAVGGSEKE